jgi:hypothetical protein
MLILDRTLVEIHNFVAASFIKSRLNISRCIYTQSIGYFITIGQGLVIRNNGLHRGINESTQPHQCLINLIVFCLELIGVMDMLPLTTTTILCQDARGFDPVRRRSQQVQQFAVA